MTVRGFSNLYRKDFRYLAKKDKFVMNPYDPEIVRDLKEAFKCLFAKDYFTLLNKVSLLPSITNIPEFIKNVIYSGQYNEAVRTIECIFTYSSDAIAWGKYCSVNRKLPDGLKKNKNHRFGTYYKSMYRDTQNELKDLKRYNGMFLVDQYRFAIMFYNIVTNTFYFSSLPINIKKEVYDACISEDIRFSDYYSYNPHTNQYDRIKKQKKGASFFNETIAWWLVYNRLFHLGLCR